MKKTELDKLGNHAILGMLNAFLNETNDELGKKLTQEDRLVLTEFIRTLVEITMMTTMERNRNEKINK